MQTPSSHTLVRLGDTTLTVPDISQDIRGRKVIDTLNQHVGHVDDLLIDSSDKRVRFLRISAGGILGIGAQKFLVPVDSITRLTPDTVQIDRTHDHIAAGPLYNPELMDMAHFEQIYNHYNLTPFWTLGYTYPNYPFNL